MESPRKFDEDKARSFIIKEAPQLGVAAERYREFSDYVLKQQRDAWIRGKEFGWKKAWKWRLNKQEEQTA
ncbi:hypothetical protein A3B32_02865 [Candidatus Uhrbacteria bacterium RIFCSPLOWO2_01_FULL_53_9]|uniref:Uncharacterized protein n=2 Tax=Candidatus Uhriibacteriota TaxID=1752732 RepID=A0A1F7UYV3_9BACT|nr:MAG: hypothetical protein A3C17_00975 [Candidatus Uhrbacteria bacterium RIFCSPHIGHO2_02_FULL_53_13]OGL82897.1 MAG: hypothetical protein A3B32_02865 [Candidatus Uhrbacteria bacterium RIFCSPLOWO2_01_FULL_53_9]